MPVVVAHSAGAKAALITAARHGHLFTGLVVADSVVRSPAPPTVSRQREHRVYPTLAQALGRFRFGPIQPCENLYILDRIARDSLKQVDGGWTWRFDPAVWAWTADDEGWNALADLRCRLALLVGEHSSVLAGQRAESLRRQAPSGTPFVELRSRSAHHLMVDQPFGINLPQIRTVLAGWGIAA